MKKRNSIIVLLITLLAMTIAGNADAQFWKKKKKRKHKQEQSVTATHADSSGTSQHALTKKEKKKLAREEKKKRKQKGKKGDTTSKTATKIIPELKTRADIIYPPTQFKSVYRIDVFASLYLDELVKGKYVAYDRTPDKAVPGVSFVEGVDIAADSLKKAGFDVDIYVHDASSFSESAEGLIKKGKLDSTDLIIGAVQPHDVALLAAFAKKKQVYFISALSASDAGVKNNQYFTVIQPSLKSQCAWILKDIAKKCPGQKIALLYRTAKSKDSAYSYFSDSANKIFFNPLLCNTTPTKQDLSQLFDTTRPNVVLIPVSDITCADSLLKALSHDFPFTHFEVYGLPSWNAITELHRPHALPNLTINITEPFHFDAASPSGAYIERAFKKDYSGKSSELLYRGYETLFWYVHLLKQYGTQFKYTDSAPTPFTPFDISPQWDKNNDLLYNENTHLFLTKYEGGNAMTE